MRPLLHRYGGALRGRTRVMPHIKSYCDYSCTSEGDVKINYFLLTSANMSKQAWGTLQNVDSARPQIAIASYELGVLFFNTTPEYPTLAHAASGVERADQLLLPIPYAIPPSRYRAMDDPWTTDGAWVMQNPAPDALGRRNCGGVSLYGENCTSRRGLAWDPPP